MFLTPEQVELLTDAKKPSAQIRWLRAHEWPFEVSSKGRPKVLASVAQARMGGGALAPVASGQPNWDALDRGAA